MRVLEKFHRGAARKEGGGVEGMDGKLNRKNLRLIPGMCLNDQNILFENS